MKEFLYWGIKECSEMPYINFQRAKQIYAINHRKRWGNEALTKN